jgi:hypothetical protein
MWLLVLLGAGLGALLLADALAESERRRQLAPPAKPPMRLLTSAAAHVTTLDSVRSGDYAKSLCQIGITPGTEVFTSPLPKGMLKLVFAGTCALKSATYTQWYGVDACYWTDKDLNYLKRHSGLVLDGKEFGQEPVESDRAAHRHVFDFEWKGGRLGVLLKPPAQFYEVDASSGVIDLAVVWQGAVESSTAALERKREEERNRRALELAAMAHLESNFLDPEYQKNYAASHVARILGHDSREWLAEYKEVIADPDLYMLIEAEHPHVLGILEARLEVVRIAQRLSVKPPPKPKEPEPKRRLTREEWEARIERYRQRQLDRLRVHAEDEIAKKLQRFEAAKLLRQRSEEMGLDEDVIERLEQELLGDLDQDEDDHTNSFKQL